MLVFDVAMPVHEVFVMEGMKPLMAYLNPTMNHFANIISIHLMHGHVTWLWFSAFIWFFPGHVRYMSIEYKLRSWSEL